MSYWMLSAWNLWNRVTGPTVSPCLARPTATSLTWSLFGTAQRTASGIPAVVLQGGSGDFSTHCFWAKTGKIIEGDWTIWKSHEVLLMICRSRFQVASSDTLEMWSLQLRLLVTWTRERSSNFVLPFVRLVNRDALMRSLQNDFASRISSRKRKFWEVHDAWKQNWKTTTELKWIYTLLENYY